MDYLPGLVCYAFSLACSHDTTCFNQKLRWIQGWQLCNFFSLCISVTVMFCVALIIFMAILLMDKMIKDNPKTETLATKMRKIEQFSLDALFPKFRRKPNPGGDAFLESNVRQRKFIDDEV